MGQNTAWRICEASQKTTKDLIEKYDLPRPIALHMAARGIVSETASSYLNPSLKSLSDPYLLIGVKEASERLWSAILKKQKILVFGDYDVDGITSSTLLKTTLDAHGADADVFIPHRFDDGYGFTSSSLEKALNITKYSLIVTVDCGISSFEAVEAANKRNIDIIITDHHEPQGDLPKAFTVINPKLHQSMESLQILSGVGVCFKLCHGFIKYGKNNQFCSDEFNLQEILDLVALGTVADIVPLLGENRILVKYGLKILSRQCRPGIRALCEVSGLSSSLIKSSEITFSLAPKINAAGRLGDPQIAYQLLNAKSILEANQYAEMLGNFNRERQYKEDLIFNEASALIESFEEFKTRNSIILSGKDWHQGVIGIVATRLVKNYNRPVIIFSVSEEDALGSARSILGVNLVEILSKCSDLLERFGGHPMAAGIHIKKSRLKEFSDKFEELVSACNFEKESTPLVSIDGEITIDELDDSFFDHLQILEPFGNSNPQPVYLFKNLKPIKTASAGMLHSKGILKDINNFSINFIAYNRNLDSLPTSKTWNIVATPSLNTYNGITTKQLQIIDLCAT